MSGIFEYPEEAVYERVAAHKALVDERDTLAARLAAVEALADNAPHVSIHVGGGNLVNRKRMVHLNDLRAALKGASDD